MSLGWDIHGMRGAEQSRAQATPQGGWTLLGPLLALLVRGLLPSWSPAAHPPPSLRLREALPTPAWGVSLGQGTSRPAELGAPRPSVPLSTCPATRSCLQPQAPDRPGAAAACPPAPAPLAAATPTVRTQNIQICPCVRVNVLLAASPHPQKNPRAEGKGLRP